MVNKLNTSKEKKLNAIKSEILEITDFVTLNKKYDDYKEDKNDINSSDTLTLTNIIDSDPKAEIKDDLSEIKNETHKLKSMLTKQEILLKEILSKIK